MSTKKQLRLDLRSLLNDCRQDQVFTQGSKQYIEALAITTHMPIVYGQREDPDHFVQFKVSEVYPRNCPSYLCLHVFQVKTAKWIPLTSAMIFKPGGGSGDAKKKRVIAALRLIVKPQISAFRMGVKLPIMCPLTNRVLRTKASATTHVDHYSLPFSHIVRDWIAAQSLEINNIDLDRQGCLKDLALAGSFAAYHREVADLQLVDKTANMEKGAKLLRA